MKKAFLVAMREKLKDQLARKFRDIYVDRESDAAAWQAMAYYVVEREKELEKGHRYITRSRTKELKAEIVHLKAKFHEIKEVK